MLAENGVVTRASGHGNPLVVNAATQQRPAARLAPHANLIDQGFLPNRVVGKDRPMLDGGHRQVSPVRDLRGNAPF
jgi:hypothetical protein